MICPSCAEPLVVLALDGVEADHCVTCRGTWLDAGELELLLELGGTSPGALHAVVHAGDGRRGKRRCPRCRRRMRLVVAATREVDRCPRGHGLWLDRGELEALVRSGASGDAGLVAEFLGEVCRHELARTGG